MKIIGLRGYTRRNERRSVKKKILILTVAITAAAGFLSCNGGTSTGPGDGDGGTTNTPSDVVDSLEQAINARNEIAYRALMHDSMTFYFDGDDVGRDVNGYAISASWPLSIDYAEIKSLYANTYSINCEIDENAVGQPTTEAETYTSPAVSFILTWYESG